MAKKGKKYREAVSEVDRLKKYTFREAVQLALDGCYAKFDETVDIAVRLGVDPRHADQMVRGTVVLPHGTGKEIRVLVFAKGEKEKEALDAGADYAGSDEYVEKIQQGWLEFDKGRRGLSMRPWGKPHSGWTDSSATWRLLWIRF